MITNSGIPEEVRQKVIGLTNVLIPHAKIYLFGSRARGDYNDRSDIDLALDAGEKLTRRAVGEVRDVLEAATILYKVDILDLNNVPEDVRNNVLKEAIIWKN